MTPFLNFAQGETPASAQIRTRVHLLMSRGFERYPMEFARWGDLGDLWSSCGVVLEYGTGEQSSLKESSYTAISIRAPIRARGVAFDHLPSFAKIRARSAKRQ